LTAATRFARLSAALASPLGWLINGRGAQFLN
jgi:hypothetical protein